MGEQLTPEQAAQRVKDGDRVLVTLASCVRTYSDGTLYYNSPGGPSLHSPVIKSVELLPPEPQPGEWWLVEVEGAKRVLVFHHDRWSVSAEMLRGSWPPGLVTPIRQMTFADGDRG